MPEIFSYTEACKYAYDFEYDMNILPENKCIELYKEKKLIKKFQEIGNCIFVLMDITNL